METPTLEVARAYRNGLAESEGDQIDSQFSYLERFDQELDSEKEQLEKRFDVDAADGKIQGEIADIEAIEETVAEERKRLKLRAAAPVQRVVFHQEPTLARSPVAPNVPMIFASWSLGGLVVGVALGWWLGGLVMPVGEVRRREPSPELRRADAW